MSDTIQEPVKGGSLSSLTPWAQSVTRAVNALVPFASPGMLHRSGPAGFGGEPLPVSRRARPSSGGPGLQPWTFRCTIRPGENGGEETREGGWLMPRLQFGYYLVGDPRPGALSFTAEELAQTDDGDYYVKCDSNNETFALVRQPPDSSTPLSNDYRNGIVYFFVGTVSGGVQTVAPHMTPVFYYYV